MKIRCVVFAGFSRTQDTFPFQSRVLKIKQQGQIQPCNIEIPEHLSYVRVSEAGRHFGILDRGGVGVEEISAHQTHENTLKGEAAFPLSDV
jgi:hypothetical protein